MTQDAAAHFRETFLSEPLSAQIAACDDYELAGLIELLFRQSQPVLEAGSGSGRWCAWLGGRSIRSDGVDWSSELCSRAAIEIPDSSFYACDMSAVPVEEGFYGGVLALGSVEHTKAGPEAALAEFWRVLRPGGVALVTIPNGSFLRLVRRAVSVPSLRIKAIPAVRRMVGRPVGSQSLGMASGDTVRTFHPEYAFGEDGAYFYQYRFSHGQMREFLTDAGFEVALEFSAFHDEGIHSLIGRLARWPASTRDGARLGIVGRAVSAWVPTEAAGHMRCFIVTKPLSTRGVST